MQFEALIAIVSEELEEEAIESAKKAGAGGVTLIKGHAIGLKEKKLFLGLTLEDNVSILFFVLPRKLTTPVFKALRKDLDLENEEESKGLVLTLPISHFTGITTSELELFEDKVQNFL